MSIYDTKKRNVPTRTSSSPAKQQKKSSPYDGLMQMASLMGNSAMEAYLREQQAPQSNDFTFHRGGQELPTALRERFEKRSGISLDDVRVHRNSDKPTELGAEAYAQGNEIHLGPGQEEHLEHELGHVVQQKEGRVGVTEQRNGLNINDDKTLEQGADLLSENSHGASITQSKMNVIQMSRPTQGVNPTCGIHALMHALIKLGVLPHYKRITDELPKKAPDSTAVGDTLSEEGYDSTAVGEILSEKYYDKIRDLIKNKKTTEQSTNGEFYRAEDLSAVANKFLQDGTAVPSGADIKGFTKEPSTADKSSVMTQMVNFTTKEEMMAIFTTAKAHGVKVLIPYYAGGDIVEPTSTAPLDMSNAHWAMRTDKGLSEGWRDSSAKTANDNDAIFASNQFIRDTYTEKEIGVSKDITVKASTLKGRAILVGKTDDVATAVGKINGT